MSSSDAQWLVYDRREQLAGKPGTHALVIGVSAYRYLPSGTEEADSTRSFGLHKLTSASRSAYVFQNWLQNNADQLATPLKTLRLLLAPSPAEVDAIEGPNFSQAGGGFEDLVSGAYAWREDAAHDPRDAIVFYFAGNGFDLGPSDPMIALADFGAPRGPVLGGSVAVNSLIQGLAPSLLLPEVARTQLYLIDAGRRRMSLDYEWATAMQVFDLARPWIDDRKLAVCHASSPGEEAYAPRGGPSLFLIALMRCFHGEAAVPALDAGRSQHRSDWQVTVNSLVEAIPSALQRVVEEAGAPEQRAFVTSISGSGAVLVRLDGPPIVQVTVKFSPPDVAERAVFDIRNADNTPVDVPEGGQLHGQRKLILPAGNYLVRISFRPPVGGATIRAEKDVQFIGTLMPPRAVWSVEVTP